MRPTLRCCGEECEVPAFLDLRGLLSFWLLWELRLGPLRGAQLADRLAWRRGSPLSPGTLYPALAGLERARLVRKRRRGRDTEYEITPVGRADVRCARGVLRVVLQDVTAPGDAAPGGGAGPGPGPPNARLVRPARKA